MSKRVVKCYKPTWVSWWRDHAAGKYQKQAHARIRSHVDKAGKSEMTIGRGNKNVVKVMVREK